MTDPFEEAARDRRDLARLLLAAGGEPTTTGDVFTYKHRYATCFRLAGFFPVVAVWPHGSTSRDPPRLLDVRSAADFVSAQRPFGKIGTERFGGSLADWRVLDEDDFDGGDDA